MVIIRTKDSKILKIYPPAHSEGKDHLNFPPRELGKKILVLGTPLKNKQTKNLCIYSAKSGETKQILSLKHSGII